MNRILIVFAFAALAWTGSGATAQSEHAQLTFWNKTGNANLYLYVDDEYGCMALKNLRCTTHLKAGEHELSARLGGFQNQQIATKSINAEAGKTYDWEVVQ